MNFSSVLSQNLPPLAERIRPQVLDDFIGQKKILHEKSILFNAIKAKQPFSFIFWGPPGTGKTTLARIFAREFEVEYFELSAISSGVSHIRDIINKGKEIFKSGKKSILFIDEIHRFSKSQQSSLLSAVEEGAVILMGSTTENPSFEIIQPLLSRCQVLQLQYLTNKELCKVLNQALKKDILLSSRNLAIDNDALSLIIDSCGGDARKMLNILELSISMISNAESNIKLGYIKESLQEKQIHYDKNSDFHYDVISAFIKSIRGSDPDAAIYWLAVMLEGGEKPEFISRRLIILASEDIGNAEPYALQLATAAFDAVHKIGMPESRIILAQITTYLAAAPKSNAAYLAIDSAVDVIRNKGIGDVPLHLRNASTQLMKNFGYGQDYKYPQNFDNNFVEQNYFPETFKKPVVFYIPGNEGREKFLKERLEKIWRDRYK